MISYAQNQEDVVLFRLRSEVDRGTYIDVGAAHPIIDNVTYALYLEGWRGINVEPMAREVALLRSDRPDDTTLQIALGEAHGRMELFEAPLENRGATTFDRELVARYEAAGQTFRPFEVDVWTLDEVIAEHHQGDLHIVKIDVEGAEASVLAGFDLALHRPWVLVMEATLPNSRVGSHSAWERQIVDAGYNDVLFDGLNRFYVRDDLPDVASLLSVPANVFDEWVPMRVAALEAELESTMAAHTAHVAQTEEYVQDLLRQHRESKTQAAAADEYVQALVRQYREAESYAKSLEVEIAKLRASLTAT